MSQDKKESASSAIACRVKGCKHSPHKFSFCGEHFNQFKFGLINKHGEPSADFEKKLDQYEHKKANRKTG